MPNDSIVFCIHRIALFFKMRSLCSLSFSSINSPYISDSCKKVPIMDKFEFPPKKNIGRRDAKLVEDRRQRLQNYLRYMVHILSNTMSPSKPPLFTESLNKQKFLQLLPFFADPPVLNSNSRTASPALGHCPGGRRSSTQLSLNALTDVLIQKELYSVATVKPQISRMGLHSGFWGQKIQFKL